MPGSDAIDAARWPGVHTSGERDSTSGLQRVLHEAGPTGRVQ